MQSAAPQWLNAFHPYFSQGNRSGKCTNHLRALAVVIARVREVLLNLERIATCRSKKAPQGVRMCVSDAIRTRAGVQDTPLDDKRRNRP